MSDLTPLERQRLLDIYVNQYNQTNLHITQLLDALDDIRNNINTLISYNMGRNNQTNRSSVRTNRNNRQYNLNHFNNPNSARNHRNGPFIRYDYNNPIERSTYISEFMNDMITGNTANIHRHENNQYITDFLTTFLNSSVPVIASQDQIDNASRLVSFSEIQNPISNTCAISLEPFSSEDIVRQLHHCGHIFFPEPFNQWFSNNVRCPVCRHDIRSFISSNTNNITPTTPTTPTSPTTSTTPNNSSTANSNISNPINNIVNQLTMDISNNELSDNLISTIASRFFTNLLNPSANTQTNNIASNGDRLIYDPETDSILFETILRPNNSNHNHK